MTYPVIAIDGASGVGKGTVSRQVARALGWHLLDSGALYRLVALVANRAGIGLSDEVALAALVPRLDIAFEPGVDEDTVRLAGEDVSDLIRTEACGSQASQVAVLPAVRQALVGLQRGFRRPPGLVADGRDMGGVIFPDASLKIFLSADPKERARRRYKQLKGKGIGVSLAALHADIAERDKRDASRAVSPLVAAPGAIHIDTTRLGIDDVVARVLALVRQGRDLPEP